MDRQLGLLLACYMPVSVSSSPLPSTQLSAAPRPHGRHFPALARWKKLLGASIWSSSSILADRLIVSYECLDYCELYKIRSGFGHFVTLHSSRRNVSYTCSSNVGPLWLKKLHHQPRRLLPPGASHPALLSSQAQPLLCVVLSLARILNTTYFHLCHY